MYLQRQLPHRKLEKNVAKTHKLTRNYFLISYFHIQHKRYVKLAFVDGTQFHTTNLEGNTVKLGNTS